MSLTETPKRSGQNIASPNGDGIGVYVRIADNLRQLIQKRQIGYDYPFPSHRQLSADFGVSIGTIQRAVRILVSEGILAAKPDHGIFVTDPAAASSLSSRPGRRTSISPLIRTPLRPAPALVVEPYFGMIVAFPSDIHSGTSIPNLRYMSVEVAKAFEQAVAIEHGSTSFVNVCGQGAIPQSINESVEKLIASNVDGIVLITPRFADSPVKILDSLSRASVPIVAIENDPVNTSLPQVYFDSRDAGRQAASHLLSRGCQSLQYFSIAPLTEAWVSNRLDGVRDAALTQDCDVSVAATEQIFHRNVSEDKQRAMRVALDYLERQKPDGVVASNDHGALIFMEAAESLGLRAGEDYLIVGFDDTPDSQEAGLTTLRPPLQDMANEAAALLMRMIGSRPAPGRVCLNSHLVVRQSTRSPHRPIHSNN